MGLKEQIFGTKLKIEKLHIKEWGFDIYIRRMNGHERDVVIKAETGYDRALVAMTLCDEKGTRQFDTADELKDLDAGVIFKIAKASAKLNGLDKASQDEIAKN
jgi:hypothetical protein